ncbi:MAG: DegV family protein [Atribacterota bacterium]|nr:DegV family protein [Atribacterota bacterium]MDD4895227.1 DegV family protein [Atribacterota bacterium]MDD5637011.1 DegV family protein [Atribacterota bacterium]
MKIQIKYINGIRFKRFIMTSAQRIGQTKDHLNDINVFPVADGDTGTNLAITMNNIVEGVQDFRQTSFELMIQRIAKSALKGARGNSGAILAQFFQGLAEATRGMNRLTTVAFSQAAVKAVEQAAMAIAEPCEGTIITVMRDWANHVNQLAHRTPDFVELFKKSLKKARVSLLETPEKLAILKQAGVVDAGAEGFVNLLEGIVDFIEFGRLRMMKHDEKRSSISSQEQSFLRSLEKSRFRFCTECLLEGNNLNRNLIRDRLTSLGDSQVVAGSDEQLKIHIHTNQPDLVFSEIGSFGTIVQTKVDDMWEQTGDIKGSIKLPKIALVTDSTCDLPDELIEKYNIKIVPIAVQVNEQSFLDRVNISTTEVLDFLENPEQHVTTSQPPYQYFEDIYQKVGEENEAIISIHISGKLSGTFQAACVASKQSKYQDKIQVIDAKTSSVGLGLIVLQVARLVENGIPLNQLIERINNHIQHCKIFVSIPTLKYLIRSGRLDRIKGFIGSMIHLKPVITLDQEGAFEEAAKVVGLRRLWDKTLELASQFALGEKNPYFAIAHIQDINLAKWYQKELKNRFPQAEIYIAEGSPALSVHIGRGGTAIAVMGG